MFYLAKELKSKTHFKIQHLKCLHKLMNYNSEKQTFISNKINNATQQSYNIAMYKVHTITKTPKKSCIFAHYITQCMKNIKLTYYIICVLLLISTASVAQVDSKTHALREQIVNYYNNQEMENFNREIDPALHYLQENQEWDTYFFLWMIKADVRLYNGEHEDVLAEAQEVYEFSRQKNIPIGVANALNVMAIAYSNINKFDEAEEVLYQAVDILKNSDGGEEIRLLHDTYVTLIQNLIDGYKFDEAEKVLPHLAQLIERVKGHDDKIYNTWLFNLSALYSILYIEIENIDQAAHHVNKMDSMIQIRYSVLSHRQLLKRKMWLAELREQHDEALVWIDSLKHSYRSKGENSISLSYVLDDEIRIARKNEDPYRALDAYKEYRLLTDSIQRVEMSAQLDDLRTRYEVDRHILEKDRNRNYAILAAVGLLLALIALSVWILYYRRLKVKNKSLIERIREQDRLQEQLQTCALERKALEPFTEVDELFERITQLVEKERAYTDSTLNRTSMAALVGSNESYVRQSIRRNTGLTVNDYLNSLRLRHARDLLVDRKQTIETIATDSGFGSRGTFHNVFKKEYGLTPDEFRRFTN